MRPRPPLFALFLLALGATPALAMDLQGKWGLGVGAGGLVSASSDVTVFRGRSATSGWLIDLEIRGSNATGHENVSPDTSLTQEAHQNTNDLSVRVGPGIRHFLVASGPFSPYLDFGALVEYSRSHDYADIPGVFQRDDAYGWGFGLNAAVGAEYLTPWHFSLAAHTQVGQVMWTLAHYSTEVQNNPPYEHKSSRLNATASIQPLLELRVYF